MSISKIQNIQGIHCQFSRFNRLHQMLRYEIIMNATNNKGLIASETIPVGRRDVEEIPFCARQSFMAIPGIVQVAQARTCVQWLPYLEKIEKVEVLSQGTRDWKAVIEQ